MLYMRLDSIGRQQLLAGLTAMPDIDRLQRELHPHLPDFDGAAVAAVRNYRRLSMTAGLKAFRAARMDNVKTMIRQHDSAHKQEIAHWRASASTIV
jgi:hypothetical protein